MSTLKLSVGLLILMFLLGLVGCSSTVGLRSATTPKIRTIATIGDRPLPVVTGEPGDAVVAERARPEVISSRVDDEGRISGRVVDERGEPVALARVRLAVGSTPGGRVNSVTTDRAGGFTLRGLRPGTPYTVIAEYEDAQGAMTGRSRAQAPETDVRIALAPIGADSGNEAETAAMPVEPAAEARINHVSRRDLSEAEDADGEAVEVVGTPINVEDLPPAPEAETIAPVSRQQTQGRDEDEFAGTPRGEPRRPGAWTRPTIAGQGQIRDSDSGIDAGAESAAGDVGEPIREPRDRQQNRPASPTQDFEPDDDGENPLPPALEPEQVSQRPSSRSRRGAKLVADRPAPALGREHVRASGLDADRPEPVSVPETPPGALVAVPPSSLPDAFAEVPDSPANPVVPDPDRDRVPDAIVPKLAASQPPAPAPVDFDRPNTTSPPSVASNDGDLPPPVEAGPAATPAQSPFESKPAADPARPRPRWGDLVASRNDPPPLEPAARKARAGTGTATAATTAAVAGAGAVEKSSTSRLVRGSPKEPESYCRFDPKLRRIEDFRLPDLQGRLVRLQDFDADLILLDFWGTWCQPCIRSVPHLVDLQKRIGGKQLQVVGIACEREEVPPTERAAGVSKMVEKLGVNYPVLVSSLDGSCPLQKALRVQAYPTLILVDRQGRILWQDQGATPTTLARLDRMLTVASKADGRRRY